MSTLAILRVLAAKPGARMKGPVIAKMAGLTTDQFSRRVAKLLREDKVSKFKDKATGYAFHWYFMTEAQAMAFLRRHGIPESTAPMGMLTETHDMPGRLVFLRMLKEKTVYRDWAVLDLIINDYERTFKLRGQLADRIDREVV